MSKEMDEAFDCFEVRANKRRLERRALDKVVIDAGTFVPQLQRLTLSMSNLVLRQGYLVTGKSTMSADISVILRQILHTYSLLIFINADDHRYRISAYRPAYSFVSLPLVRTMIDGFYNVTAMIYNPKQARTFRISGYHRRQKRIEADEAKYGSAPGWSKFLSQQRSQYEALMRADGITEADLSDKKNKWDLLGTYLDQKPDNPHKAMLRQFTVGFWRDYSSISHTSYDGLLEIFPYLAPNEAPHLVRDDIRDNAELMLTMHLGRASGILAALLTEIQAYYRFENANTGVRLHEIWRALQPVMEVRELYDGRYKRLMLDSRIRDIPTDLRE